MRAREKGRKRTDANSKSLSGLLGLQLLSSDLRHTRGRGRSKREGRNHSACDRTGRMHSGYDPFNARTF